MDFYLYSRYQFFLQLKSDVESGRLHCPKETAVDLSALVLQGLQNQTFHHFLGYDKTALIRLVIPSACLSLCLPLSACLSVSISSSVSPSPSLTSLSSLCLSLSLSSLCLCLSVCLSISIANRHLH